jgi:hypothetical protein
MASDNGSPRIQNNNMKKLKNILGLTAGTLLVVGLTGCDSGNGGGGGGGGGGSGSKTSSYEQPAVSAQLFAQSGSKPSEPPKGSGTKTNAPSGGSGSKTNAPSGGSSPKKA